jgi:hypothetical protein
MEQSPSWRADSRSAYQGIIRFYVGLYRVQRCEISSSHGGEYDVQSCLLGYTAGSTIILHGSITQKTALNIEFNVGNCNLIVMFERCEIYNGIPSHIQVFHFNVEPATVVCHSSNSTSEVHRNSHNADDGCRMLGCRFRVTWDILCDVRYE